MKSTTTRSKLRDVRYEAAKAEYLICSKTLRQICKEHKVDKMSFSIYLNKNNVSTVKKIDSCDTTFEVIDTEDKAYWLGFLYADGAISYKETFPTAYKVELALKESDKEHVEKFKLFMKSERKIRYREKTKAVRIIISSKKLCESLIYLGCTPRKSLTLTFPNKKQVPEKLLKHFIRGYFDGDGHISINKNTNCLMVVSMLGTSEFLNAVIHETKLTCSLKKDKRHLGNTFSIRPRISESIDFLNYIYKDAEIYLTRKYSKYLLAVQHRNKLNYEGAISVKGEIPNTEISQSI